MSNFNQPRSGAVRLTRAILGGLAIGLPAAASPVMAMPGSALNPCPGIYYEEPFASNYAVPQGCPANAATQRLLVEAAQRGTPGRIIVNQQPSDVVAGERMPSTTPGRIIVNQQPSDVVAGEANPPVVTPEDMVIATVPPTGGEISVRLVNNTNALITYEATGQTARLSLPGGETTTLEGLPVPTTVTLTRQDGGLIQATPMEPTEPGLLVLSLDETTTLGRDDNAITVQEDGDVLAY